MKKHQILKLKNARTFARQVAEGLKGGEVLALIGPLGSGKTTFTKALGRRLGIKKNMPSPTFALMHFYKASLPKTGSGKKPILLYHLDLYRTKSFAEADQLGLHEFWGKKDTVTVIEWADKIKRHLPKKTRIIEFQH